MKIVFFEKIKKKAFSEGYQKGFREGHDKGHRDGFLLAQQGMQDAMDRITDLYSARVDELKKELQELKKRG